MSQIRFHQVDHIFLTLSYLSSFFFFYYDFPFKFPASSLCAEPPGSINRLYVWNPKKDPETSTTFLFADFFFFFFFYICEISGKKNRRRLNCLSFLSVISAPLSEHFFLTCFRATLQWLMIYNYFVLLISPIREEGYEFLAYSSHIQHTHTRKHAHTHVTRTHISRITYIPIQ